MNDIYIMHQYYEKSHFNAIYETGLNEGWIVKRFIILDKKAFIKQIFNSILAKKNIKEALVIVRDRFLGLHELKTSNDKNLIVGLAPYDELLIKYSKIIRNHHSVYFTSSTLWNSLKKCERGRIENRSSFISSLKKDFSALACVSNETQKQVGKYVAVSQVVGHSIDVEKYEKKNKRNDVIHFLFLGHINKRKNVPLIIQWIESNQNNFYFDFIGPLAKKESNISKRLLDLEKRDQRVNYLGTYSKKQIMSVLKNYDFLVLPSLEEKFGIVLIEALAANVPCVVSNTIGPSEIIENRKNGIIFDLDNPDDFSQKMSEVLSMNIETYNEMMNNAGKSSKDFDVNNVFKKWKKLLV